MSLSRKYKGLGEKGFTLVELAVVLIILGAIFMAVLKVESMVKNAKIRQTIKQYRDLHAAVLSYRNKYGYLPGDDPNATKHFGVTRDGDGDGNIFITKYLPVQVVEYENELSHLEKAGFLKGATLTNPFGGVTIAISILTVAQHPSGYAPFFYNKTGLGIYMTKLPGDIAQSIDTILDDGKNSEGSCVTNSLSFTVSSVELVCFVE